MPLLVQVIWGDIWKHTVEISQTNATNVSLPLLRQAIWGHIWKVKQMKRLCIHLWTSAWKMYDMVLAFRIDILHFIVLMWDICRKNWNFGRWISNQLFQHQPLPCLIFIIWKVDYKLISAKIGLCLAWFSFYEIVDHWFIFLRQNRPLPCLIFHNLK